MRKVFVEDLPKKGRYVDWGKTIGNTLKFVYDDITGEFPILDYIQRNGRGFVVTNYNEKSHEIWIGGINKGRLGAILGVYHIDYLYNIGDIILSLPNGELEILEQTRIEVNGKNNRIRKLKGYVYKCKKCGDVNEKTEDEIKRNGCNVCAGQKVLIGYNDLWTIRPDVARLLKNPNRGYEVMQYSNGKEIFKCPTCGYEKAQSVCNVTQQGIGCPKCNDGASYPEKFLFNMLEQLNMEFEFQKRFKWSLNKTYDFFITSLNCIIETHGEQHYNGNFVHYGGRSLIEEQENDKLKEKLAKYNDVSGYIVVDCRKSDPEFIKENILNSKLSELFELKNIDWVKCHESALSSRVKIAWELWNSGKSIKDIAKIIKIHKDNVRGYIKRGVTLGICEYDPKEAMRDNYKKIGKKLSKKVVQLTLSGEFIKEYESMVDAKRETGASNIVGVCSGNNHTSGGYKWMYKEDYDKYIEQNSKILQ